MHINPTFCLSIQIIIFDQQTGLAQLQNQKKSKTQCGGKSLPLF